MKDSKFITKATKAVNKAGFQLKKYSPEILVVTGVIGTIAGAVMACKATLRATDILEKTKEDLEIVKTCKEKEALYTEEMAKKDVVVIYAKTSIDIVKVYAPAVIIGALSITSILASSNILRKRNVALAAAYTAVDKGFKEYRNRVVSRFGEEVDKELKYNLEAKKIQTTEIDPETGEEKTVTKTVKVAGLSGYSEFAQFFDESCRGWEKNPEYNLMFIRAQQQYANDLLRSRGHLFLNEVYDTLGMPRTRAGQIVGWVYDTANPHGDNYVDFGIFDTHRKSTKAFIDGYERVVILDFNVDGPIIDCPHINER